VSTYDDNERSVSQNRPIDLYTITTPTKTYRLTSHVVDVQYGGFTYVAATMSRGNQQVAQDLTGRELVVYLPISHPFVQRFVASGLPEHGTTVRLLRMQSVSGSAIQQWDGFAQAIAIDGHVANVRCPSATDDPLRVKLPQVAAQRQCNHVLYDAQCSLDRSFFAINPPAVYITAISGNTISLSTVAGSFDQRFQFGEVLHGSGQRRMVLSQVGTVLTLNAPFVDAVVGDGVIVYSGCNHDIVTCRDKFNNVVNYGGMPEMLGTFAPWSPGSGLGVIQQP
jgi:uncharacterized phage protein (TIGR02218 family)